MNIKKIIMVIVATISGSVYIALYLHIQCFMLHVHKMYYEHNKLLNIFN